MVGLATGQVADPKFSWDGFDDDGQYDPGVAKKLDRSHLVLTMFVGLTSDGGSLEITKCYPRGDWGIYTRGALRKAIDISRSIFSGESYSADRYVFPCVMEKTLLRGKNPSVYHDPE